MLMKKIITELWTACITKNTTYKRKNTYSKIINVGDCKTSKKILLAVKYPILIMFNYPTAKTRTLYINLQMHPLKTRLIQTGWEFCIEPYPN
jgi:hypothetical protein